MLNALPPRASKTFDDYAKNYVFLTIEALSAKYKRTDVVFDVYLPCSLKSETREKEGKESGELLVSVKHQRTGRVFFEMETIKQSSSTS